MATQAGLRLELAGFSQVMISHADIRLEQTGLPGGKLRSISRYHLERYTVEELLYAIA
jgi:hypothetical protein